MITILAVGKKHEEWIQAGLERYQKRLKKPFDVSWVLLPHSKFEGTKARQEESERIATRLAPGDFVVLLDERGRLLDSPGVQAMVQAQFVAGRRVVWVVGGAYGVSQALHDRADTVWSLSPLVFPHQLVRLLLIEQVYRAQEIGSGGNYHHM